MYCCYADFLYAVFLSHIDYINHTKVVCGALQLFALPYWSSDQPPTRGSRYNNKNNNKKLATILPYEEKISKIKSVNIKMKSATAR